MPAQVSFASLLHNRNAIVVAQTNVMQQLMIDRQSQADTTARENDRRRAASPWNCHSNLPSRNPFLTEDEVVVDQIGAIVLGMVAVSGRDIRDYFTSFPLFWP
jgi:hypothetical protein